MDPKIILWPTDLSSESIKAAPKVLAISQQHGAAIVLMYVAVDLCNYFPAYGNFPADAVVDHFRDWERKHARKLLEDLCEKDLKACPNLSIELASGDPVEEILKMAEARKADMIVMTRTHGAHGLKKDVPGLGLVAEAVAATAGVPVLFVAP